jgi:DNA repair protein RecN (Recombination protein N)
MLMSLTIHNLAVIETATVHFERGFHVLTGETGAGKSMIIDALSIIAGGRGSQDMIRNGADKAVVECLFDPPVDHPVWAIFEQLGIAYEPDDQIVIRRELNTAGKSIARVNQQLVNISTLKQIGEWLINIHGQHEHQSLLKTEHHIELVDSFAKHELEPILQRYKESYQAHRLLKKQLDELRQQSQQKLQMIDIHRFQLEEIDAAKLTASEDFKLEEDRLRLANAEKLFQAVNDSYEAIYDNQAALSKLNKATHALGMIEQFDEPTLKPLLEQLQGAYYQVEDAAFQLRDYRDNIEFNPQLLDRIEKRLDLIHGLKRKYGESVDVIIARGEEIRSQLMILDDFDGAVERMETEVDALYRQALQYANQLTQIRKSHAEQLAKEIVNQLKDLQMEKTTFEVKVEPTDKLDLNGQDEVEFLFSANPGEPLKSLSKIASGGELSRVMLALKTIFAKLEKIPVLVFDEVDTGVSGRAAQAIAEKLAWIASSCQVFSITHLPQVACMADVHFLISKSTENSRTFTQVTSLLNQARTTELARMLGGVEVTDKTLSHAEEMLQLANNKKQQWQ